MKRREFMRAGAYAAGSAAIAPLLQACGGGGAAGETVSANNGYRQTNLVATSAKYSPLIVQPGLVDAWGVANRPAGAGGHFWVTASGVSYEYVGDVNGTPLHTDGLAEVALPASSAGEGASNGVIFNTGSHFVITQAHANGPITAPAKFLFCSDNGVLSAWTERQRADGGFDRPVDAITVLDDSANGSSFFGLAVLPAMDGLLLNDFGANPTPRLRYLSANLVEEPLGTRFANPFLSGAFKPGDLVPFNVHTVTINGVASVFVMYVNTSVDPKTGALVPAVEDAGRGRGRLVQYSPAGQLIATWDDRGALNGPWGIVMAPANFGPFSNQLIVGNFSDGTLVGFDVTTRRATEYMRDTAGNKVVIQGLWGLLFGNGQSLGDSNALYFGAGPEDETAGIFGSLRYAGA
ncbi:TIGR03118 family protein [Roseateles sp. NT4]|uniref:TIGR03118 family protein n=1 Tax=Roseateles sp. NT4 TaxID=3453715 RepID=UPI003EEE9C09